MDIRNGIEAIRTRANQLVVATVLSGVALAACGTDSPSLSVNTAGVELSTPATDTATSDTTDRNPVLPGDDATIASLAAETKCGADGSKNAWSVNAEPNVLIQPENLDLLDSKQKVLESKIGVHAAAILADNALTYGDADPALVSSPNAYIRTLAKATPFQLTDAAVAKYPNRQNYHCIGGNTAVGDSSVPRDIRANKNNGDNVTLLGNNVTPKVWAQMVAAAYADGIDIELGVIHQTNTIDAYDANGKLVKTEVEQVVIEDDGCGNQEFPITPTPNIPTPNTIVVTSTPPTTPTGTTLPPIIIVVPTTTTTTTTLHDKVPVTLVGSNTQPGPGGSQEVGMDPQNGSAKSGYGPGDLIPIVVDTTPATAKPADTVPAITGVRVPASTTTTANGDNKGPIYGDPGAPS